MRIRRKSAVIKFANSHEERSDEGSLPASALLHGESELVKHAVNFREPEPFYAHALERKARRPWHP